MTSNTARGIAKCQKEIYKYIDALFSNTGTIPEIATIIFKKIENIGDIC